MERHFKASTNFLRDALVVITSNKHFITVLHVILKIGNILNENTDIGDAEGFEIASLRSVAFFEKFKLKIFLKFLHFTCSLVAESHIKKV